MDEARLLAAISAVETAMRQQTERDRARHQLRIDAIHAIAERVNASYASELAQLNARIEARLLPVEPFRQSWNVFRVFEVEHQRARWTQWLGALLGPEHGSRCARVAWTAFCDAAARRAAKLPSVGSSGLADASHWEAVAEEVPAVEHEAADLLVTCPSMVITIEVRLSDASHTPAAAGRAIAENRLSINTQRRLGLVLLTPLEGLEHEPADYIQVSWRDLGQALRRALRNEWSYEQQAVVDLWPIILTLVSIEQDLLDFALPPGGSGNLNTQLKKLSELASYLEER
ncbi:MAG: hypothetical protein WKG01_33725 [Kofleriaceae bacterium]